MAKKDYIPDDIPSFNEWIDNYLLNYPTLGATLGLSAPEITAGTALITAYKTAYTAQVAASVAFKNAAQDARTKRSQMLSGQNGIRKQVQSMKANSNYTLAIGETLQIEVDETAIDINTAAPVLRLRLTGENFVEIFFKKLIFDGIKLESKRGNETSFSFLAFDTEAPYLDTRANLTDAPERREYRAYFMLHDQIVGVLSAVFTITVG